MVLDTAEEDGFEITAMGLEEFVTASDGEEGALERRGAGESLGSTRARLVDL